MRRAPARWPLGDERISQNAGDAVLLSHEKPSRDDRMDRLEPQSYGQHGCGLWAVIRKETIQFAGQCGLILQRDVKGRDELEIFEPYSSRVVD